MKIRTKAVWGACLLLALLGRPAAAMAQTTTQATPAPAPAPQASDPDSRLDPLQPDFTLTALPTTLRMPVHKVRVPGDHMNDSTAALQGTITVQ